MAIGIYGNLIKTWPVDVSDRTAYKDFSAGVEIRIANWYYTGQKISYLMERFTRINPTFNGYIPIWVSHYGNVGCWGKHGLYSD